VEIGLADELALHLGERFQDRFKGIGEDPEREVPLKLRRPAAKHLIAALAAAIKNFIDQGGLADARLTGNGDQCALAPTDRVEEPFAAG